ncbi:MAG: hypothetical protein HUU57_10525 [Bdellovibrio sp.]|nr:hypothetical protein [Bdellovibrio sp.]
MVFGTHTLYVQERDDAGNWSTSGSASFDVKCTPGEYLQATNCIPCPVGSYQSLPNLNASCDAAPIGSYVLSVGSTSATTCPANSTTLATGSTQLNQCLGNEGFYSCESGVCSPADASYYSPANDNSRYACPANSYTQGSGAGADDISDCLAGIDFYNQDGDAATAPLAVGAGFYSAYRNDSRTACTNVPANATSVIYSGSGGGSNNCPISSVLTCSPGFTPAGISCSDNSPSSIIFTNLTNHQLNSLATSNEVALSGFDGPLTATCSDCADIARNGAWAGGTTLTGFMPGDTIAIRRNSAMSYSTDVIATVTLGVTTSSNWVITSRAPYSCNVAPWGNIAHNSGVTAYSEATPLPTSLCATLSEVRTCNDGVLSGSFAHSTCQNGCSATPWGNVTHGYSNSAYQTASVAYGQTCVSQARVCSNGTMSGSYTFTSCTVPACVANVGQSCATSNTGYYQHIDYADGFTCEVQKGNAGEVAPCANPSAGYVFAFKQCSGPRLDCAQTQLGTVKCNGTCN